MLLLLLLVVLLVLLVVVVVAMWTKIVLGGSCIGVGYHVGHCLDGLIAVLFHVLLVLGCYLGNLKREEVIDRKLDN